MWQKFRSFCKLFGVSADWLLSEEVQEEKPPVSETVLPAYPDWVQNLPKHMGSMVRKFGWLYGVRMAIGGFLIALMGFAARMMFRSMLRQDPLQELMNPWGNGDFSLVFGGQSSFNGFFSQAWNTSSVLTGFMIALGLCIGVAGAILAVALKKWGSKQNI